MFQLITGVKTYNLESYREVYQPNKGSKRHLVVKIKMSDNDSPQSIIDSIEESNNLGEEFLIVDSNTEETIINITSKYNLEEAILQLMTASNDHTFSLNVIFQPKEQ